MKMKVKFRKDELTGLYLLLGEYIDQLKPDTIAEKWVLHEIRHLHMRLLVKSNLMSMQRKSLVQVVLPLRECFAFVMLMEKHPVDPTNYIDNMVLKMVNLLRQALDSQIH